MNVIYYTTKVARKISDATKGSTDEANYKALRYATHSETSWLLYDKVVDAVNPFWFLFDFNDI